MRVIVLTNPGAGPKAEPTPEKIRAVLESAGVRAELRARRGVDLVNAAARARDARPDAVVAAGGDGTVSAVAAVLAGSEVPLGVLPTGTLNHFARDLGIPSDLEAAAAIIAAGNVRALDVGEVNGRIFINNASIGIYPHLVQKRDEIRQRLGRGNWIAMLMAALSVLKRYPTVTVRLTTAETTLERSTPFVFVGNNPYEISLNMLGRRHALDRGVLCVHFSNRGGRFGLLRLAMRALAGRLNQDRDFDSLCTRALTIAARRRTLRVAMDGEVLQLTPPLQFRIRPGALKILAPAS